MVLTDRQRADLHAGIYEYLQSRGDAYQKVVEALAQADPECTIPHTTTTSNGSSAGLTKTPLLEKKWTAIPRLQKKVLELERQASHHAKIHAHRSAAGSGGGALEANDGAGGARRLLPRLPCQHTLQGHSSVVTCVRVHPVFTVVVSGSEDGSVKVWDHESGEYIRTLKGHTNTVNGLAFTPTGSHLASCSTDLSIKLWDFQTYACIKTLRGHDHTISSVVFLPLFDTPADSDGASGGDLLTTTKCKRLLSASRDCTVKVWDLETGFCDQTIHDHNDWVRTLATRADGSVWASAGNDTVIYVYEQDRMKKAVELRGHEQVVESIAFLTQDTIPKNNAQRPSKHIETVRDYLVSGSRDRTVRLWKVSEASCLMVLKAHDNWVRSVLIHPNGNYILSSSDDKSIRVFDIKNERCLRTLENAHNHFVSSLDMHATLPILVSGSVDQTIRCWPLD
jgi:platelet-activating factor acetylhydrolase IB subunit alpha